MYLFDVWGVFGVCSGGFFIFGFRFLGGIGRGRLVVGGGISGGFFVMILLFIFKILISF